MNFESWIDSQKSCLLKKSHLLMIQDKAELVRANLSCKVALGKLGELYGVFKVYMETHAINTMHGFQKLGGGGPKTSLSIYSILP